MTPKEQIIEALRSDEYPQTTGSLERSNGFCCLGVICKVAEKNGIHVNLDYDGALLGNSLKTQPEVQKWSGLFSTYGKFGKNNSLMALNDLDRKNFKEIADIIEEKSAELFDEENLELGKLGTPRSNFPPFPRHPAKRRATARPNRLDEQKNTNE